ncbi:MAG: hypothetical protein QOG15_29 [Solirubrobacteraceae bacterium]|jgi:hypothetical protein|nr:hypothetical protein [Solirubrobacteraceae bacterium]
MLAAVAIAVPAAASEATHTVKFTAKANQVTTASSPVLSREATIDSLRIAGHSVDFEILPGRRDCIAYGSYRGTVVRITDCDREGHRQRRFTVRAYSMGRTARVIIKYH